MKTTQIATLLITLALSAAAQAEEIYSVRQDAPDIGSMIKRQVAEGPLPFDKRFEELTAEQVRVLRSLYVQIRSNDEPPFPRYGLKQIAREIARGSKDLRPSGKLLATVRVDQNGDTTGISIVEIPHPNLTEVVNTVLMNAKFKPAKCDGQACEMDFPLRIMF